MPVYGIVASSMNSLNFCLALSVRKIQIIRWWSNNYFILGGNMNKRSGFTMIELIFTIVIIGILSAIALPKFTATRDDAKIEAAITSGKLALSNLLTEMFAKGGGYPKEKIKEADKSAPCFHFGGDRDGTYITIQTERDLSRPECGLSKSTQKIFKSRVFEIGLTEKDGGEKKYYVGGSQIKN